MHPLTPSDQRERYQHEAKQNVQIEEFTTLHQHCQGHSPKERTRRCATRRASDVMCHAISR
ncbi:MAG: hypothetical protein [Microvirus sp.]|nr:MAG: hypothetical protein [Microvirus sp.]